MHEFQLPAMSCGHCVQAVTEAAHAIDPQARVEVDLPAKQARVESARPRDLFVAALAEAGYPPA